MSLVQRELESLLETIDQAAQKADSILELSRVLTKYPDNLDMILLDTISELYLMKTPITQVLGSMTSTRKS